MTAQHSPCFITFTHNMLNLIVWSSIAKSIDNERSNPLSILYGLWVLLAVFPMWGSQLLQYASSRQCLFGFTYLGLNTRLGLLGSNIMLNLIVWGYISKPIGDMRSSPSTLYGVWVHLVFPTCDSQLLQYNKPLHKHRDHVISSAPKRSHEYYGRALLNTHFRCINFFNAKCSPQFLYWLVVRFNLKNNPTRSHDLIFICSRCLKRYSFGLWALIIINLC